MKTSDKGKIALLKHEAIVPAPYKDSVGVWTYGVGHTAAAGSPIPANLPKGMPADLDAGIKEAMTVFAADLVSYEDAVNRAVKVPVSQHEFDALVSFHYNTGAIARAEVTRLLNKSDRIGAAAAFLNWRKPAEILDRRKEELLLFQAGLYPGGNITVWKVSNTGRMLWKVAKTLKPEEALELMGAYWTEQICPNLEEPEDKGLDETDEFGTPLLGRGSKGPVVGYAQKLLNNHGANLKIDNDFGRVTEEATKSFQKKNGLDDDGKIGKFTWSVLNR